MTSRMRRKDEIDPFRTVKHNKRLRRLPLQDERPIVELQGLDLEQGVGADAGAGDEQEATADVGASWSSSALNAKV